MSDGMRPDVRPNPFAGHYYGSEELREFGFRQVGRNVRIHSRASIYRPENIELADDIRIDDFTVIVASGPLRIGSFVNITNFCFLGTRNGIRIGDFVMMAPGVKLFSVSDDYTGAKGLAGAAVPRALTACTEGPVEIGRHAILGANCVVLPNVTVGEGSALGAGSLASRSLEPWGMYAGVPARRLKDRSREIERLGQLAFAQAGA
jgi:acetyltransferase-like isoleucine patch superfamily enzyme